MSDLHLGFCLAIGESIENAAKRLPEGYEIVLGIEKGGFSCRVVLPNGEDLPVSDDGVSSSLDSGVKWACEHDHHHNAPENQP